MIIIVYLVYAMLTSVKATWYECYDHITCAHKYDDGKIYCYNGICTDRCPPGYNQTRGVTIDSVEYFNCTCDTKKGFEEQGFFEGPFTKLNIPKCNCTEKNYCTVTVYAEVIGYTDGLIPRGQPPNCKIETEQYKDVPQVLSRFGFLLVVITMSIFLFIHCRSASGVIYDFHRYFAIYVLGSMMVIVFTQTVVPFSAGFTRSMGFGIVLHNAAEWNLLMRLHFGKTDIVRNGTNVVVVLYYFIMLLLMATCSNLELLLYIAMVQGGFLDWTFVIFVYVGYRNIKPIKPSENWEPVFRSCCHTVSSRFVFWYGFAAFFHLVSVEILFAGFILNNGTLVSAGGFLLLPMFLFYLFWVFGQDRILVCFGPSLLMKYSKSSKDKKTVMHPFFKHTTRTVDLLYHFLAGREAVQMIEMEASNSVENIMKKSPVNDEEDWVEDFESRIKFMEDYEIFKTGVHAKARKCPCKCLCTCCSWIPLYWYAAFLIISVNAGILIFLPGMIDRKPGCNPGYDYGAW